MRYEFFFAMGITVAVLAFWPSLKTIGVRLPEAAGLDNFLTTVSTTGLTLAGFVLTGITLLAAFGRQMTYLRNQGAESVVHSIFWQCTLAFLAVSFFAFAALIVKGEPKIWLLVLTGAAGFLSIARSIRVLWVFRNLLKSARTHPSK